MTMTACGRRRPNCGTLTGLIAALVLAGLLSSCASDQQRTRTEGVVSGAAIGAVLGHILDHRNGAALGAVIGGAAGGVVGNQVAEKKRLYAEREDALNAAAAHSQAIAQQARVANEALQRDIAALAASVTRLQTKRMSARSRKNVALSTRRSFEETNRKLDQQLAAVRSELAKQHEIIRREQALVKQTNEPSPPSALRLVSAGIQDLESHERALERAKAQLMLLDSRRAF